MSPTMLKNVVVIQSPTEITILNQYKKFNIQRSKVF